MGGVIEEREYGCVELKGFTHGGGLAIFVCSIDRLSVVELHQRFSSEKLKEGG